MFRRLVSSPAAADHWVRYRRPDSAQRACTPASVPDPVAEQLWDEHGWGLGLSDTICLLGCRRRRLSAHGLLQLKPPATAVSHGITGIAGWP